MTWLFVALLLLLHPLLFVALALLLRYFGFPLAVLGVVGLAPVVLWQLLLRLTLLWGLRCGVREKVVPPRLMLFLAPMELGPAVLNATLAGVALWLLLRHVLPGDPWLLALIVAVSGVYLVVAGRALLDVWKKVRELREAEPPAPGSSDPDGPGPVSPG